MTIAPRWRKVWHDLWGNKVRSLLVIISIFIGVFNVGTTITLYYVVSEDMNTSYMGSDPSHAQLWTEPFDRDLLHTIERVPGVAEAEGRRTVTVRLRNGPDDWLPLQIQAVPDMHEMRMDRLRHEAGAWPPPDETLVMERSSLAFVGAEVGDVLEIRLPDDTIRRAPITGVVFDNMVGQASVMQLNAYVTYDSLEWLHQYQSLDRVYIRVAEHTDDKAHIEAVADRVAAQIRKSGRDVYITLVSEPGEWIAASQILGVVSVIGILGILSLFLAGFLIYNTLSALLSQQVRFIGVMKSIGARTGQIMGMYVVLILGFGLLGLIPAVPLAARAGSAISTTLGNLFNFNTLGFRLVPQAWIVQVAVGLLIPLGAGLVPVIGGARITVREALSNYGLGGEFGRSLIDRLVERIRGISRPLLISLRNTFRRKGRVALTLATLTLGGAIFIGVFNLQASMMGFIDEVSQYFLADVNLTLNRPYPMGEIEAHALTIPGVEAVEGWAITGSEYLQADGTASESVTLFGPPAKSALLDPVLIEGRWLHPKDENALVVNSAFWRVRPDLTVGDTVRLAVDGKERDWQVVGIFQWPGDIELIAYANYPYLARHVLHQPGRAAEYRIVGTQHDLAFQQDLAQRLEDHFEAEGFGVGMVQAGAALSEANAAGINSIVVFFMIMAVLIAAVGAIGLMGTMSMNVLERTREIGVMRAIGATNRTILGLVLVEGWMVGLISWVLASMLALPIGRAMFKAISLAIFQTSAPYKYDVIGFGIWLALALFLATLASLLPARNAARLTVREVLAYE